MEKYIDKKGLTTNKYISIVKKIMIVWTRRTNDIGKEGNAWRKKLEEYRKSYRVSRRRMSRRSRQGGSEGR